MFLDADIAAVAALLAEPSRAALAGALLDGRAHPATDLARAAHVRPSTASEHLAKLVAGGILAVERAGRHRYYRLAGPEVADVLEALGTIAPPRPVRGLREWRAGAAVAYGRTCYDHLAGTVGVTVVDALIAGGWLSGDLAPTPDGERRFARLGIDVPALRSGRRPLTRPCLDWTERRHHLGGALGAELCARMFSLDWLERVGTGRAVRPTAAGRERIAQAFGCVVPERPAA